MSNEARDMNKPQSHKDLHLIPENASSLKLASVTPQLTQGAATTSELGSILQKRAIASDTELETTADIPRMQGSSPAKPVYYSKERLSLGGPEHSRKSNAGDRAAQKTQQYTERWSSKKGYVEDKPEDQELQKTDSDILNADSVDSEEARMQQRTRQQYLNRWTRNNNVDKTPVESLDEDSFASDTKKRKNKESARLRNRWSSQGVSTELHDRE